jgi:hypothetical protein
VTADDLRRAIATYLVPEARTTIIAEPDGSEEAADGEDDEAGEDGDEDGEDDDGDGRALAGVAS